MGISKIEKLYISNFSINNFDLLDNQSFESLKEIRLESNYIEIIEVFSSFNSLKNKDNNNKIISINNKCNPDLINYFGEEYYICQLN